MNKTILHPTKIIESVCLVAVSAFILSFSLHSETVRARQVSVEEFCQIPITIIANVPEEVKKGDKFTLSNFVIKPSNTYGVTISSSITELSATNTNSTVYRQDFTKTVPSPTTGAEYYTAFYPNWVIDASGEVGSTIEIKLKNSVSIVGDLGELPCTYTKTLASVKISSNASTDTSIEPTNTPSVVALRIEVLDSYGRKVKGAKVSFDNNESTTNNDGIATFNNVLSGKKTVVIIDGDERIQNELTIQNDTAFTNVITIRKPAPPLYKNPFFIAVTFFVAVAIIVTIIVSIVKRRKENTDHSEQPQTINLQEIIQGSLNTNNVNQVVIPENEQPFVTYNDQRPSPAPWQLPVDSIPAPLPKPQSADAYTTTTQTLNQPITNGVPNASDPIVNKIPISQVPSEPQVAASLQVSTDKATVQSTGFQQPSPQPEVPQNPSTPSQTPLS